MDKKEEKSSFTFEKVYEQNKRRIHYHIHRMNIRDPHNDFFQEGLFALWNAYEKYEPNKGPMSTYFNYIIEKRLIDKIRKDTRTLHNDLEVVAESKLEWDTGNRVRRTDLAYPLLEREEPAITDVKFWKSIKENLTEKQWKWVYYFIILDMPVKEIAKRENTSEEAVKSWGKQARKKLRVKLPFK